MRYFNFIIKNENGVIVKEYSAGEDYYGKLIGIGANIAFEIQIFAENISQVPAAVRLDNIFTLDSYKEMLKYNYLEMELYAGFIDSSTFTKRNAYTQIKQTPIIKSPITNIIPDFSGITKSVWFHFIPSSNAKLRRTATQQTAKYSLHLTNGDNIYTKLNAFMGDFKNSYKTTTFLITLKADEKAQALNYAGGDTIVSAETLNGFLQKLTKLDFKIDNSIAHLKFYFLTTNTLQMEVDERCLLSGGAQDNPIILYPQDFIKQPTLTNLNGNLLCQMRLRNDTTINSYCRISGAKISSAGVSGEVSTGVAMTNPAVLAGVLNENSLYQIVAINHIGEYYNPAANSWSTQLTLIPGDYDTSVLNFRSDE